MHSTESPEISFDTKGCVMPGRFEDLLEKILLSEKQELQSEIESLDTKIAREQS